jgi:hypothetical protein
MDVSEPSIATSILKNSVPLVSCFKVGCLMLLHIQIYIIYYIKCNGLTTKNL